MLDTGVGISNEVRKRLFEPYFTTRTGGTGLGLAIARRLVEEMAGEIEILLGARGSGNARARRAPGEPGLKPVS